MKLSIIVPVYKVEIYLHECIDSILRQTFQDFELILVDDQSPDNCGAICDTYAEEDKRIRVIHRTENGGLSVARNTGIEAATGEYLTFIDSDDYIGQRYLERAMNLTERDALEADIVEMPVEVHYNSPVHYQYGVTTNADQAFIFPRSWMTWIERDGLAHTYAWNKIYRSKLFKKLRFPEGRAFEDIHTVPRLTKNAKSITFCGQTSPDERYYYRYRGNSITTTATRHALNDALKHHCPHMSELAHTAYPIPPKYKARYFWQVTNLFIDLLRCLKKSDMKEEAQSNLVKRVYKHLQQLNPGDKYLAQASVCTRAKIKNLPFFIFGLRAHCFCYSGKWISKPF